MGQATADSTPVAGACPPDTGEAPGVLDALSRLPDGLLLMNRAWQITYANPMGRRISRVREQDMNGPTHWEVYPATVGTEIERFYRRVMEERTAEQLEFFYPPFGAWLKVSAFPTEEGIALYYSDTTELHAAAKARDAAVRQMEQALAVIEDAVFSLNREWTITFRNEAGRRMTEPVGEVLGRNNWHAFPDQVYEGSPYVATYYRAMVQREPGSFEAFYPAPFDLWLHLDVRPAEDGIVVFVRDITKQREDAEALRQSERRLREERTETERQRRELEAIYDGAPVGLALFEPKEFRYLRVNRQQAETLGRTVEDLVGRRIDEVVNQPLVVEMFRKVTQGEAVRDFTYTLELVDRPGEPRVFNVNYSPVFGEDGAVRAISSAVLDVTKQQKSEAALRQSEKLAAVGRLASSISHEINNPLEAVTNLLYLMAGEPGLSEAATEYVRMAQDEVRRVSHIATQTLRFHRQQNSPTLVSPAQLVDPVLNLFQGRLVNSRIHVEAAYSTVRPVLCFEGDIRQILNNLIANAIDAMRHGGRLMVRAHDARDLRSDHAGVRITVADTGHGMSAATLKRVFEPFYTTKDLNGNGLGLWISQGIVERHQGQLRVRSTQHEVGHGTVFSLFLPSGSEPLPSN